MIAALFDGFIYAFDSAFPSAVNDGFSSE